MGREFGWLWAAYAVSAYGSGLALGAFPLIAVLALHSGPAEVSVLSAVGPAVGALVAVPLAPWVEFRRKRPVMIAMDLSRFAVLATIPVAYAFGWLSFIQLLVAAAVVAAAKITFNAASGAYLKTLVRPDDLLVANARFESTNWSSLAVCPPLGGAAIGLFGPVTTVIADALSYLLSALGITAIRSREQAAQRAEKGRLRAGDLVDGWRHILTDPILRALWFNNMLVSGLIMARLSDRRHPACCLADRSGLHPPRCRRPAHGDRGRAGGHHQHEPLQPGTGDLPAPAHPQAPDRSCAVGLVDRFAGGDRDLHRARRAARWPHQYPHRARRRGAAHPHQPSALAPPAESRARSRSGTGHHRPGF